MRPRQAATPKPRTDRRYRSAKWRRLSDAVLGKTRTSRTPTALCAVDPDSPLHLAAVADHIVSVYPGMPDAEFFSRRNVRPACQAHNKAKGFLEAAGRLDEQPRVRSIFRRRAS